MQIDLTDKNITTEEKTEIERLLIRECPSISEDLKKMWYLMDLVWDDFDCDNINPNWDNIGLFYSHSVWLLNGLFIEQDEVSMGHRDAISDWVLRNAFFNVIDFGGGFGTLARLVAEKSPDTVVDIYEPHPSAFGLKRATEFDNIKIIKHLDSEYHCLLSTDVLEHVPDPLVDFSRMIESVKVGGYLVIANCFYPVIKCHLPQNFHFRFSFNLFAKMMGVENCGILEGSHATIYKKVDDTKVNWILVRAIELFSRISFPFIKLLLPILRPIKRVLF
jgi:2-polyprenyl-3-methyl-5-hydroxy-6-metoxy-1,4-benzoquinol methylase